MILNDSPGIRQDDAERKIKSPPVFKLMVFPTLIVLCYITWSQVQSQED